MNTDDLHEKAKTLLAEPKPDNIYTEGQIVDSPIGKVAIAATIGHRKADDKWIPLYRCSPLKDDGTPDKRNTRSREFQETGLSVSITVYAATLRAILCYYGIFVGVDGKPDTEFNDKLKQALGDTDGKQLISISFTSDEVMLMRRFRSTCRCIEVEFSEIVEHFKSIR